MVILTGVIPIPITGIIRPVRIHIIWIVPAAIIGRIPIPGIITPVGTPARPYGNIEAWTIPI